MVAEMDGEGALLQDWPVESAQSPLWAGRGPSTTRPQSSTPPYQAALSTAGWQPAADWQSAIFEKIDASIRW